MRNTKSKNVWVCRTALPAELWRRAVCVQECHYLEAFCGPRTCSFKGGAWGHISWEVPLAPATYLLPGAFNHALLFFFPTLIAGDWVKRLLMVATIFIGPLFSMEYASADMKTYPFEWATIWCFFATVQSLWAIIAEVFLWSKGWAPASAEEMACVGRWRDPRVVDQGQQKQQQKPAERQPLLATKGIAAVDAKRTPDTAQARDQQ